MKSIGNFFLAAALIFSWCLYAPQHLAAQDLQYTTTTTFELPGAAGNVMDVVSRLSGSSNNSSETVYLQGNKMRSDSDESSVIFDLDERRYVLLDHAQRSYYVMRLDDLAGMAEELAADAQAAVEEARREASNADETVSEAETANVDVEYDIKVDRTGEMQSMQGHQAERVLMTMTAKGTQIETAEGEEAAEGSLVLVNEMWVTSDANGDLAPLVDFQKRAAQELGGSMEDFAESSTSFAEGMQAAFASNPEMGEMLEQAATEMAQVEGFPLRTVMKMIAVPGDEPFDAERAFAPEPEKEERSVAQKAGSVARGLLGKRFGGGGNDEAKDEQPEPEQTTLMTVTTEVTEVKRDALEANLFMPPADYAEQKSLIPAQD